MRLVYTLFITATIGLLSQKSAFAQYIKGSCLLQDGRQLNGMFQLRLATAQSPTILVYHTMKQADQEFEPSQVKHCTIGRRSYTVGGNFVAPDDKGGIPIDNDFVEVVDTTGRVQLFRYEYEGYVGGNPGDYIIPVALAAASMAAGSPMTFVGGGRQYQRTYILLLRAGTGQPLVPYTPGPRPGLFTSEQEKLIMPSVGATTAFFSEDTELQRRIETGKITQVTLPAVVRAYNAGAKLKTKN
ncbi:hypothetical protein [Hymenobacter norwichensis]|uniref:hypothetical protein n=1 Tax=Hymenobacter norwichensis TaxID=223903 RepID=UPI0003B78036|nr:hypothetical protein [Hymenobacter norwichensis]